MQTIYWAEPQPADNPQYDLFDWAKAHGVDLPPLAPPPGDNAVALTSAADVSHRQSEFGPAPAGPRAGR
jgi:hypothetical protein